MLKKFTLITLIAISLINLSFIKPVFADGEDTFYVSPSGNDSNPGTLAKPFKTIQGNMWRLGPGDVMILRGGNYPEDVTINNSGTAGKPITFMAYENEEPYITGNPSRAGASQGFYVYDKDYIVFDGINVKDFKGHWMSIWLSSHITVKNCNFSNNTINIIGFYIIHSDHITVQDCLMDKTFDNTQTQDRDLIYVENTHYSLFERLTLSRGQHSLIGMQNSTHNVVRNNILRNEWQKNIGIAAPTNSELGLNVIENNLIYGSRPAIAPGYTGKGAMGIYLNQKGNIIRRNQIYDNTNFGILADGNNSLGNSHVNFNKIYNNTILKNGFGGNYAESAGITITNFGTNLNMGSNVIKNNIIAENSAYNIYVRSSVNGLDNTLIEGNCIYRPAGANSAINVNGIGTNSLNYYQTNYNNLVKNNFDINPSLVNNNISSIDLHLNSNSGCIDKGVALTKTKSAGSGTVISVEDASYFFDGFGITDGDEIVVGSEAVRITAINYTTNNITVNRSITWGSGTSINQAFNGSAPDPGVFESGSTTTPPEEEPEVAACKADYDDNGVVGLSDFATFGANYKQSNIDCDLDIKGNDCYLNISDFQELASIYKVTNVCN